MIHLERADEAFETRAVPLWLLSAFKAGFINSAGFLATGKFVSHVTGFGTQVGLAVGHQDYFFGVELLIIPMAFILGGVITSLVLDRTESGQTPSYHLVQGLITGLLAVLVVIGEGSLLSQERFDLDHIYSAIELSVIGLLCLICGMKNSLVTWTTFGKIRVTHLTGIATDIGLNLVRTFLPGSPGPRFNEPRRVNVIRILTLVCFSTGAFISAILFPKVGYSAFLIVFFISLMMTTIAFHDRAKRQTVVIRPGPEGPCRP